MTQDWDAGRLDSDLEGAAFDTLAVRAGQRRTPEGEHGEALFTTSSYVFRTAADAAARFAGEVPGNVYSRYTNPTVRTFEERIAAPRRSRAGGGHGVGHVGDPRPGDEPVQLRRPRAGLAQRVRLDHQPVRQVLQALRYPGRLSAVERSRGLGGGVQAEYQAVLRRVAIQPAGRAGGYRRAGRDRPRQGCAAGGGQLLLHAGPATAAEARCGRGDPPATKYIDGQGRGMGGWSPVAASR